MSERNQPIIEGIEGTVTIHSDVDATTSAVLQNNWTATVAPAVTDDLGAGYTVGSEWIDVTADKSYKLADASVGAAVWIETGGGVSGAGGLVDLTGITGASNKVDLTTAAFQSKNGYGIKFTAGSDILCGQPVIWNYASGVATAITAGALPSQHEYIGIALANVTAGADVQVVTQGLVTARRDTTFVPDPSAETVILNNTTNTTSRNLTNATTFTDSGSGGDYSSNENYSITFDAQAGYTAKVTVNDIAFEHTTQRMYDRLGIQGSNDGVNFVNLSIPWLQTSASSSPTWNEFFFGNNAWNSPGADNGYIFPENTTRAILLSSGTFPVDINTGYRYIRFYFRSDSSSNDDGWNMTLAPNTTYPSSTEATVSEGATLYLDNSDYTKITTDDTSQIVVGYCAYTDAGNDSIFIRV